MSGKSVCFSRAGKMPVIMTSRSHLRSSFPLYRLSHPLRQTTNSHNYHQNILLNLIAFVLFKTNKTVTDEGLEEEYDSDEDKYEQLLRRRKAIEELAATLDDEKEPAGQEYHGEKMDQDEDTVSEHMDRHEGSSQVAGLDVDIEEDNFDLPEETVEEERELTLEELMQELEAATREMQKQNPPEEVKK